MKKFLASRGVGGASGWGAPLAVAPGAANAFRPSFEFTSHAVNSVDKRLLQLTLASKVLSGSQKPTTPEAKKLAASVLSQDEKKGQRK
jgi:hypothetical protein